MKIISMNVRGFGSPVKWRYIKDLIRTKGIKMLCLQEVNCNLLVKKNVVSSGEIMTLGFFTVNLVMGLYGIIIFSSA